MKSYRFKDTDFLYLSTRLRAAENSDITKEKLFRMADAENFEQAYAIACESAGMTSASASSAGSAVSSASSGSYGSSGAYGSSDFSADKSAGNSAADYDKMLEAKLKDVYAFACELLDSAYDTGTDEKPYFLINPFRYVYDCNNLKAAIKCEMLGKDPSSMLSPNGTVPVDKVVNLVNARDFSLFPKELAKAAPEAIEKLAASSDPGQFDTDLDRAAFKDMANDATQSGCEYLIDLIKTKIDCVNISSALRCIKQNLGRAFIHKLYIDGGTLDEDFFVSAYDETPSKLLSALSYTAYSALNDAVLSGAGTEKLCDEIYLNKAQAVRMVPFGAELLVLYIVRKEFEVKNVRIVLAGKSCGLSSEKIKERLRLGTI